MRLDLHVHSTASDGAVAPADVVEAAVRGRLDVIALADHDTVSGCAPALEAARNHPVHVVPAIEVSSTLDGRELHFLGFFVDLDAPALVAYEERAATIRESRLREMVSRLGRDGVEVEFARVLEAAGPDRGSLGRPHLARALVSSGHARDVPDAFDRYIGDGHPAFIPTRLLDPGEAVQVVLAGGGVPVWAHPPDDQLDGLLPGLVEAGLRGLEVYRPRVRPDRVGRLERLARRFDLLVSGGSDWHGPAAGSALGDFFVTGEEVSRLLAVGGL